MSNLLEVYKERAVGLAWTKNVMVDNKMSNIIELYFFKKARWSGRTTETFVDIIRSLSEHNLPIHLALS